MVDQQLVKEALRSLKLEELRLRSMALSYGNGIGSVYELTKAADSYSEAVRRYKTLELEIGATLTEEEAEVVR